MPFFLPIDLLPSVPASMLIDKFMLDFDLMDLVVWYPRLSWTELSRAMGAIFACKIAGDQVERWALAPIKSRIKRRLGGWCARRWPTVARRLGHSD